MSRELLVKLLADRVMLNIIPLENVPEIYREDVALLLPVVEEVSEVVY